MTDRGPRPTQLQRVLKEAGSVGNTSPRPNMLLLPICTNKQNAPPTISKNVSGMPLEKCKQRINELELENEKLRIHVNEAEESIRSYRGFLSHRSGNGNLQKSTRTNVYSQTDFEEAIIPQKSQMVSERRMNQCQQELTTYQINARKQIDAHQKMEQELREHISQLNCRVEELQCMLHSSKANAMHPTTTCRQQKNQQITPSTSSRIQEQLIALRKSHRESLSEVSRELQAARTEQQHMISVVTAGLHKLNASSTHVKSNTDEMTALSAHVKHVQQQLAVSEHRAAQLAADNAALCRQLQLQQHAKLNTQNTTSGAISTSISNSPRSLQCDKACEPLSPWLLKTTSRQLHSLEQQLLHTTTPHGQEITSPSPTPSTSHSLSQSHIKPGTSTGSSTGQDSATREVKSLQSQLTTLEQAHNQLTDKSNDYVQRLSQAALTLFDLQKQHDLETQAVKHSAHVRDLSRVAAHRELSLEKDRLLSDLKHAKEVAGIMSFCLNTAEQSLAEVQPHVVQKLIETRNKRLKVLEKSMQLKRRDIEQRSVDTCVVSTAHLEGFQTKALHKVRQAEEESGKLLAVLKAALHLDDFGDSKIDISESSREVTVQSDLLGTPVQKNKSKQSPN